MPEWTAEVVAQMHKYSISGIELAKASGYSNAYLSLMLNGHKRSERARVNMINALIKLIAQKQKAG